MAYLKNMAFAIHKTSSAFEIHKTSSVDIDDEHSRSRVTIIKRAYYNLRRALMLLPARTSGLLIATLTRIAIDSTVHFNYLVFEIENLIFYITVAITVPVASLYSEVC